MRVVKGLLLFIAALYIGFVIFMPKSALYYYGEKELSKKGIVIGNEELKERIASLQILHPVAYYQGADIARAAQIDIKPWIFVNRVEVNNIEFLNIARDILKVDIKNLKLNHSILKPFYVKVDANGSFGVANGYINLKNRLIHIDITKAKDINSIKRFLRRGKKGWYYESKF